MTAPQIVFDEWNTYMAERDDVMMFVSFDDAVTQDEPPQGLELCARVIVPIKAPNDPTGGTLIRGAHLSQLRQAIDELRIIAGLTRIWTSYGPLTGVIDDAHFLELRYWLNETLLAMDLDTLDYNPNAPIAPGQLVRGQTIRDLRDKLR